MSASPIRLGIIGLGFGEKVQIPAFRSLPGVEIRGVASRDPINANRVAASIPGASAFAHWSDLIASPEIDAVSVVTPPIFHAEIASRAIEKGKHVLCEKPFGMNISEARKLVSLANENPELICAVDFEFRFQPAFQAIRTFLESGAIGEIMRIDVSWLTAGRARPELPWSWQNDSTVGGGVVNAFVSHVLDYIAWFGRSEIVDLVGKKQILVPTRKDLQGQMHQVTAEDSCDGIGALYSGARFSFRVSNGYSYGSGHQIQIYGTKGRLLFESTWPFDPTQAVVNIWTESETAKPLPMALPLSKPEMQSLTLPFGLLAAEFTQSIREGKHSSTLPSFSDGLQMREALTFFDQSC